jgi:hypothetical protein
MSNCGHVKTRSSKSLRRYYGLVQEAVKATYGDAVRLDFDPANTDINRSGIGVYTDGGKFLCQILMYSTRRIVVDHRSGEVGYMVSDAIMLHIARATGGVWQEDCLEEPEDLTRDLPLYFWPYLRKTHAAVIAKHGEGILRHFHEYKELYFSGEKFSKFWDAPTNP